MNVFLKIIQSGTNTKTDYSENRSIILCNYIALILSGAVILLFIQRTLLYSHVAHAMNIKDLGIALCLFISPIILNAFNYTKLGRLVCSVIPTFFIWAIFVYKLHTSVNAESSYYDGMRIFLLAASPLPFLIIDRKNILLFILAVLPILFSFMFFETFLTFAGVGPIQKGVSGHDYQLMGMRTFIAYIIISSCCYALQYIINQNDKLNVKILDELKQNTLIIESQNLQLQAKHMQLFSANKKLTELVNQKSESIKYQHEKITSYAFSNSHIVRASVAKIAGLVLVHKKDTEYDTPWYIERINNEIEILDKTIKEITDKLDLENE